MKAVTPKIFILSFVLLTMMSAGVLQALELPDNSGFLRTEMALNNSGGTSLWKAETTAGFMFDQIGGDSMNQPGEFGGGVAEVEEEDSEEGPSDLGTKVKAGALSAILPGAGQFYNGQRKKAYIMAGAEVAIWTAFFVFDAQGNSRMDSAEEFAGIYAGTGGSHENNYWQSVGRYMDSDAYNDSRLREARALQESVSGLVSGADTWQWVNNDRRSQFLKLRADGNSAYDRRDFMILFAVVNRGISVVDAVIGAGNKSGNKPGHLETEVMGMKMEVEMLPSWTNPGAQCVISRRF